MPYIGNTTSDFSIDTGNITNRAVTALKLSPSSVGSNGQVLSVDGSGNLQWSTDAALTLIDEDNMSSNSASSVPSQQSVKAYADTKAVLTGSTNNTITTVTGANALQGEANLTFDGSTLLQFIGTTDPKIRLQSAESGSKRLELWVDGGEAVGYIAADQSASQLGFRTTGTERLRITSTGQVNIGGDFSQTSNTLNVTGNIFSSTRFNLNGAVLLWQQNRMSLGNSFIIESQQDTPFAICTQGVAQPIVLGTGTAGGAAAEHMRITSGGNVGIGTTSPAQKLDVSGNIKSTGKIYPGGNIHMPDSVGIKLGASDDFVIYHYATDGHNYIESANGQSIIFQNWNGSAYESLAKFIPDSYCQLFFNGSEKIRTTNGGVQVYGQTASNGGFYLNNGSNIVLEDNGEAQFGNSGDLTIFHDGGDSYIRQGGVGALSLESSSYVDVKHTSAGTDPVLRMVNEANTTAGALNVIRSVHDLRTCAEIRLGRNNDANDFSAAAGATQGDIQFWTTQSGTLSRKGTFINSGGLCFGTDTATANALDDYEEGTWTPGIGTTSGATATGEYRKIGKTVFIQMYVSIPSHSNSSTMSIGGLPFSSMSGKYASFVIGNFRFFNHDGGYSTLRVNQAGTTMTFRETGDSQGWQNAEWSQVQNDFAMYVSGTYFVD